jgi:putative phosphoribosyl transferase
MKYYGPLFKDRADAGRQLAPRLRHYANASDVLVLGLPRGGVPVAFEVATALDVPLDVFNVRKLGTPGQEELAMGAIASGDVTVINADLFSVLGISEAAFQRVVREEQRELERRERLYRNGRPPLDVAGKTAILVDDGLATGSSMRAAVQALRKRNPARIVVAVPVAAATSCQEFQNEVDEAVCAFTPEPFFGVGQWYENFSQTTDEEVHSLLDAA